MSRVLASVLSAAVVVGFAPSVRAEDSAKDVLEKAITAHGGAELLTKNKAGQLKAKGKLSLPGVGDVEFTQEASYMLPDKFKESIEMTITGQTISVLTIANGKDISIEAAGMKIEASDAIRDSIKDATHLLAVGQMVGPAREKGYELSLTGESMVDGKPAVGVRASMKGKRDISLFFDAKTYLMVKMEYRTTDPMAGNEFSEERVLKDYKKDNEGNMVPQKVTVIRDGKKYLEAEVTEAKYLEKLPDAEFKK
jgi:hypothetical protein